MSNRILLYGYKIQNGKAVVDRDEARIVSEIYTRRADGETLRQIADSLNLREIPYCGDARWDKHKVKRILENDRYAGKDGFAPVIDRESVDRARQAKMFIASDNENQCDPAVQALKDKIRCAVCGEKLTRKYDHRRKNSTAWKCLKCGERLQLQDHELLDILTKSHKWLKDELPKTKNGSSFPYTDPPEARIMERRINTLMRSPDRDEDEIRALIFQLASQRYENTKRDDRDRTERLRLLLRDANLSEYNGALTEKIVSAIMMDHTGMITVKYINGMEITMGKENYYGDTGKKRDSDPGTGEESPAERASKKEGGGLLPGQQRHGGTAEQL